MGAVIAAIDAVGGEDAVDSLARGAFVAYFGLCARKGGQGKGYAGGGEGGYIPKSKRKGVGVGAGGR